MPVRGDNLEASTQAEVIKHLANVDVIYTEAAYASTHPNNKSYSLLREEDKGGIYEELPLAAPTGIVEGIVPQLTVNKLDVPNYSQGARLTIPYGSSVGAGIYEAAEVDDSRENEVTFVLRKIGAV